MSLKDVILMEVPTLAVKGILKIHNVKAAGASAEDYADAFLADKGTSELANALVEEFRFAGKTVVNLVEPISGIDDELKEKEPFIQHITKKYGDTILQTRRRIALTSNPEPTRVYDIGEKVVIEFSYLGNEQRTLENFEIVKRRPHLINYVIIHFNHYLVELRCSADDTPKFKIALAQLMDVDATQVEWLPESILSESEMALLASHLQASLKGAKHKMTSGPYDTVEVTANQTVEDLSQEQQYVNQFQGIPAEAKTFRFMVEHTLGFEHQVTLTLTKKGGLFFKTSVSEEAISYVVSTVIAVKRTSYMNAKRQELNKTS